MEHALKTSFPLIEACDTRNRASIYLNEQFDVSWGYCNKHGAYPLLMRKNLPPSRCRECVKHIEELERTMVARRKQLQNIKDTRLAMEQSGMPLRFKNKTVSSFKTQGVLQKRIHDKACEYAAELSGQKDTCRSVIFAGRSGTGKTHLACAVGMQLINSGRSCSYENIDRLLRRVKEGYSSNAELSSEKILRKVSHSRFLILDGLGQNAMSKGDYKILRDLLTERYDACLPTLIGITVGSIQKANEKSRKLELENMEIKNEIEEILSERVLEIMMQDQGSILYFNWRSYREVVDMPEGGLFD